MYKCIFSGHCVEAQCDKSCPILAQTSYLLDRNEIAMNNSVFKMGKSNIDKYTSVLSQCKGHCRTFLNTSNISSTSTVADALTYCAICENWKGSQLHCTVYNLKFSKYIEQLQKSWSSKDDSSPAEYLKIWATTAKVLIISNIDYVNFKDFQSQTLLSLLNDRTDPDLTTIVVSPQLSSLVGDGPFFTKLVDVLGRQKVN